MTSAGTRPLATSIRPTASTIGNNAGGLGSKSLRLANPQRLPPLRRCEARRLTCSSSAIGWAEFCGPGF